MSERKLDLDEEYIQLIEELYNASHPVPERLHPFQAQFIVMYPGDARGNSTRYYIKDGAVNEFLCPYGLQIEKGAYLYVKYVGETQVEREFGTKVVSIGDYSVFAEYKNKYWQTLKGEKWERDVCVRLVLERKGFKTEPQAIEWLHFCQ